jgi:uncharacterized membrane protein
MEREDPTSVYTRQEFFTALRKEYVYPARRDAFIHYAIGVFNAVPPAWWAAGLLDASPVLVALSCVMSTLFFGFGLMHRLQAKAAEQTIQMWEQDVDAVVQKMQECRDKLKEQKNAEAKQAG